MSTLQYLVPITLINSGWKTCTLPLDKVGVGPAPGKTILQLPKADHYLDCRPIPNPIFVPELSGLTGDDPRVWDWMWAHAPGFISSFKTQIVKGLEQIPNRRSGKADPYADPYVVCFLCAHGIHRSRSMKHIIGNLLKADHWNVEVK